MPHGLPRGFINAAKFGVEPPAASGAGGPFGFTSA